MNKFSKKTTKNNKTIFLLEQIKDIKEIQNFCFDESSEIIAFDYDTHKLLSQNNIKHSLSDNFLNYSELEFLQQKSYKLSKWYNENQIQQHITYNSINLGELFYFEFYHLLVPTLKKFFEIKKIYEKFKDAQFVASPYLYNVIKFFTKSAKSLSDEKFEEKFLCDDIEIPLKIGSKKIPIHFNVDHFSKLKTTAERSVSFFLRSKPIKSNPTVLFINFTTLRYSKLLSLLPKYSINLIKFDTIIPAVWNPKSYSIIKNSGCTIENFSTLMNKDIKKIIQTKQLEIEKTILNLNSYDDFFKNFFIVDNSSFWSLLKKPFLALCKKRFLGAIYEIELTKQLFQKYEFTSIFVWNETHMSDLISIKIAKQHNIPINLIQHGIFCPETNELSHFYRILPEHSNSFIVWGDIMENYSLKNTSSQINKFGSPFYDDLFLSKLEENNMTDFILLAPNAPEKNWFPHLTINASKRYEDTLEKICKITTKMNEKLVIKLHHDEYCEEDKIAQKINPNIQVEKAGDIIPLIKSCSVLITMDVTTAILEGIICKKPTICIPVNSSNYSLLFDKFPNLICKIENLESVLKSLSTDKKFKEKILQEGNKFLNCYISNQGHAAEKILEYFEKQNF